MASGGRISGIQIPLFSLRSHNDFGIGDFGAADGLFAWMEAAAQRMWMLLPLLPTAPGDPSPYSTRSAFGLNPLYIDLLAVPEVQALGGLAALSPSEQDMLATARDAPQIRYDLVFALKGALLRRAFDRFFDEHWSKRTSRRQSLEAYQARESAWLSDFSIFSAISRDRHYQPWWSWPEGLRHRDENALKTERERLAREILFEDWQQWIAETQWETVRQIAKKAHIQLCGDEPFIISQDSADAWAHPTLLRRDARLGVPPDDFSATGQDWGLPYFDLEAMEKEDFQWLRTRAKKSASYYDLRRVDHAVGYFRQWIRDDKTPTGRFLPPEESAQRALGEKVFRVLSEGAGIVAEDLGVIPNFVRETLTRLGVPGYRVLRWERDDGKYRNPHHYPALSLATTGTHDTETLREWWTSEQPHHRQSVVAEYPELSRFSPPPAEFTSEIHLALLAAAENAASDWCLLPWQDVFGSSARINLPGTIGDKNWSYRIEMPTEALLEQPETRNAAHVLSGLTHAGRRVG